MNKNNRILEKAVERALSGEGAHAASLGIFDGIDWKLAGTRPKGAPHSLFQLLNHVVYWQNWVVMWLGGKTPPIPKHASGSWPGKVSPATKREWQGAVKAFRTGLKALGRGTRADLLAKHGGKNGLEMLLAIASHNSYHLGEATLLRQLLEAWPPPSGGLTW